MQKFPLWCLFCGPVFWRQFLFFFSALWIALIGLLQFISNFLTAWAVSRVHCDA
jgi:hypothetical protein